VIRDWGSWISGHLATGNSGFWMIECRIDGTTSCSSHLPALFSTAFFPFPLCWWEVLYWRELSCDAEGL
jgi:hypothetical protein